jgi:hypothetical protein
VGAMAPPLEVLPPAGLLLLAKLTCVLHKA